MYFNLCYIMNQNKIQNKNLDLGKRKVSTMNFSKVVTLPKTFTNNWLGDTMEVQVSLSQDGKLTLTPIVEEKK